jgi:hypothetical protein
MIDSDIKHDFLEFKVCDLYSSQINEMLAENLLEPLFASSLSLLSNLGLIHFNSSGFGLVTLGSLSGLSVYDMLAWDQLRV